MILSLSSDIPSLKLTRGHTIAGLLMGLLNNTTIMPMLLSQRLLFSNIHRHQVVGMGRGVGATSPTIYNFRSRPSKQGVCLIPSHNSKLAL